MSENSRKFEPVFCGDADWQANACLNWTHDPLELYATGYKEAGDRLVEFVLTNAKDQDFLIYPIVFLYRQYVELRLKEIIREGQILLEEGNAFPTHHKICDLWSDAKKIAMKTSDIIAGESEPPNLEYAEHVIKEFSNIDPDSISFRYPTTRKGDKNIKSWNQTVTM